MSLLSSRSLQFLADLDAGADPTPEPLQAGAHTAAKRMAMPNPVDLGVQVGDIFVCDWGYDQTNIDFYEITGLTGASVRYRAIGKTIVSGDPAIYTQVVANPGSWNPNGKEGIARIQHSDYSGPNFKVGYDQWAYKWDGTPKHETGYATGH